MYDIYHLYNFLFKIFLPFIIIKINTYEIIILFLLFNSNLFIFSIL